MSNMTVDEFNKFLDYMHQEKYRINHSRTDRDGTSFLETEFPYMADDIGIISCYIVITKDNVIDVQYMAVSLKDISCFVMLNSLLYEKEKLLKYIAEFVI
jgi:hypothetical protein